MTGSTAAVFVNDRRVENLQPSGLTIRDIVQAYGRDPERSIVFRLASREDETGRQVGLDERVDLARLGADLFLRVEGRRTEATAPSPPDSFQGNLPNLAARAVTHATGEPTADADRPAAQQRTHDPRPEAAAQRAERPDALGSEIRRPVGPAKEKKPTADDAEQT